MDRSSRLALALAAALAGCHVTVAFDDTRRGETRRERAERPRPLAPALIVTDDGRFRVVEPLVCPVETVTTMETRAVRRREPNVATLVVGVIVTAAGGVAALAGWTGDDPAGSPLSYLGPVGVAGGLPLAIGPVLGNETTERPAGSRDVRAPAGDEPCGARGVVATRAILSWSGLRALSAVDGDGYLGLSPFALVDAFDVGRIPALVVTATVERPGAPPLALEAVLDGPALARARDGFLAHAGFDATVEDLRKVPRLEPGALRVARVARDGQRGVRVALPLTNAGPGDAYGVRVLVGAANPEVDGRVLYVGRVPARQSVEVVGVIPVSAEADRALAVDELDVTALIKDAHGTAPTQPVRFRGTAMSDPTR